MITTHKSLDKYANCRCCCLPYLFVGLPAVVSQAMRHTREPWLIVHLGVLIKGTGIYTRAARDFFFSQ